MSTDPRYAPDPDILDKKLTIFGREVPAVYVSITVVGIIIAIISIFIAAVQLTVVHPHSIVLDNPYTLENFSLPYADGSGTFNSGDQQGKVTVYYFGFTSCPDVCPATMLNLKRMYEELTEEQQAQVDIVFITIDWETDTAEMINQYTHAFHDDFIGLAGTGEEIQPVIDEFNVTVRRAAEGDPMAPGYRITHTDSAYVVDQEGTVVLRMAHGGDPDPTFLARDIIYVLNGRIKTVQ